MIVINNIDDIKNAIGDSPFFVHVVKDGYQIFQYIINAQETFPSLVEDVSDDELSRRKLLRECRGITFDMDGNIIRRPYQKFHNYGEKDDETSVADFSKPHHILHKYDGSNISPFYLNGEVVFGTKMGITDTIPNVLKFIEKNDQYRRISQYFLDEGKTPNFEWCTLKQQIVIPYMNDMLILTGVRDMKTGEYMRYEEMRDIAAMFNVQCVESFGRVENIEQFIETVKHMKGQEGFVVRWDDGFSLKFKADDYIRLHGIVNIATSEKLVFEALLNETMDDIIPSAPEFIKEKLIAFQSDFNKVLLKRMSMIRDHVLDHSHLTKKEYYEVVSKLDVSHLQKVYLRSFSAYKNNEMTSDKIVSEIMYVFNNCLNKKEKIENNRWLVFDLAWHEYEVDV